MTHIRIKKWRDKLLAEEIMSQYKTDGTLSLFELVIDLQQKKMAYDLSPWVLDLVTHFQSLYGQEQGEQVTREIISEYLRGEAVLH